MTKRKKTRQRDYEIEMEIALFRSKLKDELDQGLKPILKPSCHLIDGKILMRCVVCGILKERTTEHFYRSHDGENFESCRAGYECLHNSILSPCVPCKAIHKFQFRETEEGFVYDLVRLYNTTGLTIDWFYETLKQQQGRGPISGKVLQLKPTAINSAGIHKYDNDLEHTPDNCFLEIQELNVCQHEAIPCLFCSWKQLFNCVLNQHMFPENQENSKYLEYVKSQYFVKPKDIGIIRSKSNITLYNQECNYRLFPHILRKAIQYHIKDDIKVKRFKLPQDIPRKEYLQMVFDNSIKQLEKQSWKCAYTKVNLTIANLWTRFSFERINDDESHFTQTGELTNIVFICRLLNTPKKLSHEKIANMFLHQNLIPVPDFIRTKIYPNSSLDQVAHKVWTQREIDLCEFTSSDFTNDTLSCDYCFLKNKIKTS
jgi:hypothetical protein